ncbi:YdgA family protein [Bisgaard Taxon 45]
MKKSLVALGVIVALGAVWTGSAWYTGKSVEDTAQQRLDLINAKFVGVKPGSEAKFDNLKIERGIFSSHVTYDFVAAFPDMSFKIPFESTVYHGPFPLDRIKHFDFSPILFSTHDRIVKNEETQAWFDYAQGQNPFESQIKVGYDSTLTGQAKIAPAKLDLSDVDIVWKGIEANFDKLTAEGVGQSEANIEGLKFLFENDENATKTSLELNNIKAKSDLKPSEWQHIPLGKQTMEVDSFRLSLSEQDMRDFNIEYRNMSMDINTQKNDAFVDYNMLTKAPEMLVNGKSIGEFHAGVKLAHVEGNTMNTLLNLVENTAEYETLPDDQVQALAKTILKNQPLLQIDPLKLTTDSGELKANLVVEIANGDIDMLEQGGNVLSLFKQLTVNVDLSKDAMIKLVAMTEEAQGKSKEEAMLTAAQIVEESFAEAITQGVFVENEKTINLGLLLENNALKLNGQPIPEEQVLMMVVLFFLGMGY